MNDKKELSKISKNISAGLKNTTDYIISQPSPINVDKSKYIDGILNGLKTANDNLKNLDSKF